MRPSFPFPRAALSFHALLLAACSSAEGPPSSPGGGGAGTGNLAGSSSIMAGAGGTAVAGSFPGGSGGAAGTAQAGAASGGSGSGGLGGAAGGASAGAAGVGGASGAGGASNEPFALKSSAFKEGEEIPLKYKCENVNPKGQNFSPPLSWGPGPAGTKSYAIVFGHLPTPEHWVIWDIPSATLSLPENVEHKAQPAAPLGSKQSFANLDGFMGSGYLGPCPQSPNARQSYKFTLYALDVESVPGLGATSTPTEAANAVKAHLVAGNQGVSLTGTQIQIP